MVRFFYAFIFLVLAFILSISVFHNSGLAKKKKKIRIRSTSFKKRGSIPVNYAKDYVDGGENISVGLKWKGVPKQAKSLVIIMWDQHKIANNWVHWLVVDIPPDITEILEGASGSEDMYGVELDNSFEEEGYGGPGPPAGSGKHKYIINIYALDIESAKSIELYEGILVSRQEFLDSIQGHILAKGSTYGYFELK